MRLVSLSELLAGARPDDHCVALLDGERISLSRLRADISHNTNLLTGRCIRRGTVVCNSGYWFAVGVLALAKLRAHVMIAPNALPGTLRAIASDCDVVLTDLREVGGALDALQPSTSARSAPFNLDIGEVRLYFFTSGSTGEMKRVEKSFASFEHEAAVLEQMWGEDVGAVPVVGTVTHQHMFGMTFRIMWPLISGRPFDAEFHVTWEPLMAALTGPSIIITSPAQLTRLGGFAPEKAENRPRMIITAGSPLPPFAAREAAEVFGCQLVEIFGSTEAGIVAWRYGEREPGLWEPLPTVDVSADQDGVLMLRSPHASGSVWCKQSDRISFEAGGRFRLEGRIDRIVKIEGKRVSLQRMERQIVTLEWVSEAAVVALGKEGGGAYLGAVVKLSVAGLLEIQRLGKFRFVRKLRRELSASEDLSVLPRRWRFVDLMPTDGLGKRRVADFVALLKEGP
jgi:acyl-coenzyme A synthetase/AMP-(fatty) acid ligase